MNYYARFKARPSCSRPWSLETAVVEVPWLGSLLLSKMFSMFCPGFGDWGLSLVTTWQLSSKHWLFWAQWTRSSWLCSLHPQAVRLLWDMLVKVLLESRWMVPMVSPLPRSQSLPLAVGIKQNVPLVNWHWLVAPHHLLFLVPGTPSIMAYSVTVLGTEAGLSSLKFPRSSVCLFEGGSIICFFLLKKVFLISVTFQRCQQPCSDIS